MHHHLHSRIAVEAPKIHFHFCYLNGIIQQIVFCSLNCLGLANTFDMSVYRWRPVCIDPNWSRTGFFFSSHLFPCRRPVGWDGPPTSYWRGSPAFAILAGGEREAAGARWQLPARVSQQVGEVWRGARERVSCGRQFQEAGRQGPLHTGILRSLNLPPTLMFMKPRYREMFFFPFREMSPPF